MSDVLPASPVRPGLVATLRVAGVVRVARVLARLSPHRIHRILDVSSRGARPATRDEASAVRDLLLSVSPYCRGGSACLVRSISVMLLCRLDGVSPQWSVGVLSAPPFTAHAWIEVDEEIVDEPMRRSDFRTLVVAGAIGG